MLKILAAPALLALMAAAVPAQAANVTNGNALRRDISQLNVQIAQARNHRAISVREAAYLDGRVRTLGQTWRAYSRGGFNPGEKRSLEARIDRVRSDLARQAHDGNARIPRKR